jgi:hypothetical protein
MTLNAYAECHYTECHIQVYNAQCYYAECSDAECHGAGFLYWILVCLFVLVLNRCCLLRLKKIWEKKCDNVNIDIDTFLYVTRN